MEDLLVRKNISERNGDYFYIVVLTAYGAGVTGLGTMFSVLYMQYEM